MSDSFESTKISQIRFFDNLRYSILVLNFSIFIDMKLLNSIYGYRTNHTCIFVNDAF